jgi:hypothetical protein
MNDSHGLDAVTAAPALISNGATILAMSFSTDDDAKALAKQIGAAKLLDKMRLYTELMDDTRNEEIILFRAGELKSLPKNNGQHVVRLVPKELIECIDALAASRTAGDGSAAAYGPSRWRFILEHIPLVTHEFGLR